MDPKPTNDAIQLREYVDMLHASELDSVSDLRNNIDRFQAVHDKAHEREHQLTNDAIGKASEALERQLAGMSATVSKIADDQRELLTKAEFSRFEEGYQQRHKTLSDQVTQQSNMWSKLQGQMILFVAIPIILSLVATVVGIWQVLSR